MRSKTEPAFGKGSAKCKKITIPLKTSQHSTLPREQKSKSTKITTIEMQKQTNFVFVSDTK